MMTNESAILGLLAKQEQHIADLHRERADLIAENATLREQLAEHDDTP